MYFSNSQERRDLPIPATPMIETSRARDSSAEAWKRSLTRRSSAARPTKGASSPAERPSPRRCAATRSACQRWTGSVFPLSSCSPASPNAIAASDARRVVSPTRTVPGWAALWIREAVLTRSPVTMPCPSAPSVTAASPVCTPARRRSSVTPLAPASASTASTRSRAARTARSASSSRATGAPQSAITASPMNFSIVPP